MAEQCNWLRGAATLAAASVLAACGSTSTTATGPPTETRPSVAESALTFSKCMRADGVPNFPDLSSNGMRIEANGRSISVNGVSLNAPAFLAARAKCQKYRTGTATHPTVAQSAQQQRRGLEFARCMRSHGVPTFPDPKIINGPGGQQQAYLPGINPQSPAFQAAAKRCGGGPKGP